MSSRRIDEICILQMTTAVGPSEMCPPPYRKVYWFHLGVVCQQCAAKFGRHAFLRLATFYEAECDCCKETKVCTERRDYKRIVVEE